MNQIRRAFTLVEIIIVVVVIGILALILIPTINGAIKHSNQLEERLAGTQPGDLVVDGEKRVYVFSGMHISEISNLVGSENSWEIIAQDDPRYPEFSHRFILHSAGFSWEEIEQKLEEKSETSETDEDH